MQPFPPFGTQPRTVLYWLDFSIQKQGSTELCLACTGSRNRTHVNGFGDRRITTIRCPQNIRTGKARPYRLFHFLMNCVLATMVAEFVEFQFLLDRLFVARGVVINFFAFAASQFYQSLLSLNCHNVSIQFLTSLVHGQTMKLETYFNSC